MAYPGIESDIAGHMVEPAGALRPIRSTLYLCDVHDGAELWPDCCGGFYPPAEDAGKRAPLPLYRLPLDPGSLRDTGGSLGIQCSRPASTRGAGGSRHSVDRSSVLSLLAVADQK